MIRLRLGAVRLLTSGGVGLAVLCSGSWLRYVAEDIRLCTPVMDMLSASTQFGVIAVSDDDHREICQ